MRLVAISLFGLLLGWIVPSPPMTAPPSQYHASYLVALHTNATTTMEDIINRGRSALRSAQHPTYERLALDEPYYLVHLPPPAAAWITWLKGHSAVRLVQKNHQVNGRQTTPSDPYWEEQWNLRRIDLPAVWSQPAFPKPRNTAGKEQIVVGILEKNGFDLSHPDLREQVWTNRDEIPGDGLDNDRNGYIDDEQGWNFFAQSSSHTTDQHGTKVAGLLGARSNNEIGISGIAPDIAFIPLSGLHYEHQIVRAYLYLRDLRKLYNETNGRHGAYIVATNASFGVNYGRPQDYPIWCEVFDKLGEVGILSVSSVMNAPEDIDRVSDIPTSCTSDFLITVTESNYADQLPPDAAYGRQTVDLAAPGRGSFTTFPGNRYGTVSRGTSFAAPHVSGTIALLYQSMCTTLRQKALQAPGATALHTKQWIMEGVDTLTGFRQKTTSGGRLSAVRSYQRMQASCSDQMPSPLRVERVFPNPFTQEIQILLHVEASQVFTFRLFDMQGRPLFLKKRLLPAGMRVSQRLQFGNLPPGVYNLVITSANGQQTTHRLIKTDQ